MIDSFIGFSGSKILLAVLLELCCLSLLSLEEREKGRRTGSKINFANLGKICLLLLWLSLPIILPFMISQFSQPIYHTKYAICALPAFFLLAVMGIERLRRSSLRMAAILVIVILSSFNIRGYYSETRKEQWREASKYVDQKAMPGDLVLFNAGGPLFDVFNYYSQRKDITKQPFPAKTIFVSKQNIKEIDAVVSGRPRIWLVLSHSPDSEGLIKNSLLQTYILSDHKTYLGVELFLFAKK
jgi:4-amino-4-deoxy-L-arabinose transferase-like glycosyltransferase